MTKALSIVAVLVATTAIAAAEPTDGAASVEITNPAGYLGLGGTAGLSNIGYAGFALEGGARLGSMPLYVRGQLDRGIGQTVFRDGTYQSYRLGIEVRHCDGVFRGCLFGGVDGGVRRAQLFDSETDMEERLSDPMVIPRAGIELGSRVKARIALELPTSFREEETLTGFGVTVGVAYVF
jgi:hypothetical protein